MDRLTGLNGQSNTIIQQDDSPDLREFVRIEAAGGGNGGEPFFVQPHVLTTEDHAAIPCGPTSARVREVLPPRLFRLCHGG